MANFVDEKARNEHLVAALARRQMNANLAWDDLAHLRAIWPHFLLVKDVLDKVDAAKCVEYGVDGIILSNHGGRQLDCVSSPIEILPGVSSICRVPILVDGGFRRGADILKTIALGGRSVLLGRAAFYGLAASGEAGVSDVIAILKDEVDRTLAQIGCASIGDLNCEYLAEPARMAGSR